MLKKEAAVEIMRHLVECPNHGYSQNMRWGDGSTEALYIGGNTFYISGGDRDCSSAVINAYETAGISCGGASYTGNMRSCMCNTGNFIWHPGTDYIAQPGDVYLNEANHTAMCLTSVPDMLMEFSISETGGIDGETGDQTGGESHIAPYYNDNWDGILECVNYEPISGGGGGCDIDVTYAVQLVDGTILPFVTNTNDYAGEPGREIANVAIQVSQGSVEYRVHVKGGEWLPKVSGCDWNDFSNGYAGDGRPIDAIQAYLWSPDGSKYLHYKVSPLNSDYCPEVIDTQWTDNDWDYAGIIGQSIDKLSMYIA